MSTVAFLMLAAILNLNNWIYYYIKIGEMASHVDDRAMAYGNYQNIMRARRALNWTTGFLVLIVAGCCTIITIQSFGKGTK